MKHTAPQNSAKVTLRDIARESGVSPATVSLVLRDKPGVGAETRQRVLACAEALGYDYQPARRADTDSDVTTLGLIIKTGPDDEPPTDHTYGPVIAGIEAICRRQRLNLLYATLPVDAENNPLADLPPLLTEPQADGLLLVGLSLSGALAALVEPYTRPLVLVDGSAAGGQSDAVVADDADGAYKAVKYLIEHGHQDIALLNSQAPAYPSLDERRSGYLRAVNEYALIPYIADCPLQPDTAVAVIRHFLIEFLPVTAIFAATDALALAAMQAGRDLGFHLPTHLSIIGFGNTPLARHVSPSLTTVHVDKLGLGRLAVQLLLNRLDYPAAAPVRAIIRPALLVRQSVGSVSR